MPKVYVDNRNKVYERFCTAFDGEQVQINPGAKRVPIDEKFTWKMHPDIALFRQSTSVFRTAEEEAADNAREATSKADVSPKKDS